MMKQTNELNYIIIKPRQNINLNIFESEKYEPAIIVQQLVGTLVYYSNFGRCEPRLAESWERTDEYTWKFNLKDNLFCENGEHITPNSFKKSLEKSLYIYEKMGGVPVLSSLKGYQKFQNENHNSTNINELEPLDGLIANESQLIFKFDQKIKSGLLQILAFTPFGYICSENFTSEGKWKNDLKFISSGPYIVDSIEIGKKYTLAKNPKWTDFKEHAPSKIYFTHSDTNIDNTSPTIIDAFTNEYKSTSLNQYQLVLEYLNSILLGNTEKGYFKSILNRQKFKSLTAKVNNDTLPSKFGVNIRSNTFYPNQQITLTPTLQSTQFDLERPTSPLIIEGSLPIEGTARWYAWTVLKKTLDSLNFPYKFAGNESSFAEITNKNYDIRIRGSSIGGGVEAWGLFVSFCSSMGINFPDPDGRVCSLINDYEKDKLNDEELSDQFFPIIEEQAAILPISHYGVNMFISDHLDTTTFSPLMAIMKFDQINIRK